MLDSVLSCPHCRVAKQETMPTNACQFYYDCSNCKMLLRPNRGDCCVFCSFGSVNIRRCKHSEDAADSRLAPTGER